MDGWTPKGGAVPPAGDGAFERFLTAAIAAIITIMFSWRLLDDMNDDTGRERVVVGADEGRRRREALYAALAATDPNRDRQIAELDIDEGGSEVDSRRESVVSVDGSVDPTLHSDNAPPVVDRGNFNVVIGPSQQCSTTQHLLQQFTSSPPLYLTDDSNYHFNNSRLTTFKGSDDDGNGGNTDRIVNMDSGFSDNAVPTQRQGFRADGRRETDLDRDDEDSVSDNGVTTFDWPLEVDAHAPIDSFQQDYENDTMNLSGDSDEQPRALDSDEELFCCNLLEPIIEEDSDDLLSSSGEQEPMVSTLKRFPFSENLSARPALSQRPRSPPPPPPHCLAAEPASREVVHRIASSPSPKEVVECVFSKDSPLIPTSNDSSPRSKHSSPGSQRDSDDSESDNESVQTVIRRDGDSSSGPASSRSSRSGSLDSPVYLPTSSSGPASSRSSRSGSLDSSPVHLPTYLRPELRECDVDAELRAYDDALSHGSAAYYYDDDDNDHPEESTPSSISGSYTVHDIDDVDVIREEEETERGDVRSVDKQDDVTHDDVTDNVDSHSNVPEYQYVPYFESAPIDISGKNDNDDGNDDVSNGAVNSKDFDTDIDAILDKVLEANKPHLFDQEEEVPTPTVVIEKESKAVAANDSGEESAESDDSEEIRYDEEVIITHTYELRRPPAVPSQNTAQQLVSQKTPSLALLVQNVAQEVKHEDNDITSYDHISEDKNTYADDHISEDKNTYADDHISEDKDTYADDHNIEENAIHADEHSSEEKDTSADDNSSEDKDTYADDHSSKDKDTYADDHSSEDKDTYADDHSSKDKDTYADDHNIEENAIHADDHSSEEKDTSADDHSSEDKDTSADDHSSEDKDTSADDHSSEDTDTSDDDRSSEEKDIYADDISSRVSQEVLKHEVLPSSVPGQGWEPGVTRDAVSPSQVDASIDHAAHNTQARAPDVGSSNDEDYFRLPETPVLTCPQPAVCNVSDSDSDKVNGSDNVSGDNSDDSVDASHALKDIDDSVNGCTSDSEMAEYNKADSDISDLSDHSDSHDSRTSDDRHSPATANRSDHKDSDIDCFVTELEDEPFTRRIEHGEIKARLGEQENHRKTRDTQQETEEKEKSMQPTVGLHDGQIDINARRQADDDTQDTTQTTHRPTLGTDFAINELEKEPFARRPNSRSSSFSTQSDAEVAERKQSGERDMDSVDAAMMRRPDKFVSGGSEDENRKPYVDIEVKKTNLAPLLTEFEDEPFSRRPGSGRFSQPPRKATEPLSKADVNRSMDMDNDSLSEYDHEPFVRRPSGRSFTRSETNLDDVVESVSQRHDDIRMTSRRGDASRMTSERSHADRLEMETYERQDDKYGAGTSRSSVKSGHRDREHRGGESYKSRAKSTPELHMSKRSRHEDNSSSDSELKEFDEEPFARRVGGRQHSPARNEKSHTERTMQTRTMQDSKFSPLASSSPPPERRSHRNSALVLASPTVSMPTPSHPAFPDVIQRQGSVDRTRKPRHDDRMTSSVPESPTVLLPRGLELGHRPGFPQQPSDVSARIDRVERDLRTASPTSCTSTPVRFEDADVSSGVEDMPRGYSFTRCKSEITRTERRIFLVDKPFAPDFESLINAVPFTSEGVRIGDHNYYESQEDAEAHASADDNDDYSAFVHELHRPVAVASVRTKAEFYTGKSLHSPPLPLQVDDGCILSGNLASPPAADVFKFPSSPPVSSRLPAVSSVAHDLQDKQAAQSGEGSWSKDKGSSGSSGQRSMDRSSKDSSGSYSKDKGSSGSSGQRSMDRSSKDSSGSYSKDKAAQSDEGSYSEDKSSKEPSGSYSKDTGSKESSEDVLDESFDTEDSMSDREKIETDLDFLKPANEVYPSPQQQWNAEEKEAREASSQEDIQQVQILGKEPHGRSQGPPDRQKIQDEIKNAREEDDEGMVIKELGKDDSFEERMARLDSRRAMAPARRDRQPDSHTSEEKKPRLEEAHGQHSTEGTLDDRKPDGRQVEVDRKADMRDDRRKSEDMGQDIRESYQKRGDRRHLVDEEFEDVTEYKENKNRVRFDDEEDEKSGDERRRRRRRKKDNSGDRGDDRKRKRDNRKDKTEVPADDIPDKMETGDVRQNDVRYPPATSEDSRAEVRQSHFADSWKPASFDSSVHIADIGPVLFSPDGNRVHSSPDEMHDLEKKHFPESSTQEDTEPILFFQPAADIYRNWDRSYEEKPVRRTPNAESRETVLPAQARSADNKTDQREQRGEECMTSERSKPAEFVVPETSPRVEAPPRPPPVQTLPHPEPTRRPPPRPKPRQSSLTRPVAMPRRKSLGDNAERRTANEKDADDSEVFHPVPSVSEADAASQHDDSDEEKENKGVDGEDDEDDDLLWPKQSTPISIEKRPRSLKELRRKQKTPKIGPFVLPDHMVLPSRLKIMASRRQFLSSDNIDQEEPGAMRSLSVGSGGSLQEQFAAHKLAQQHSRQRRYKSANKVKSPTSPTSFSQLSVSQDQLDKLHYLLNYSRQSESSFDRSMVDHLHDNCILTPQGRRHILDKTLSIENLHVMDLPQQETNLFPETNLDIFHCMFQPHEPLGRSASMSDMIMARERDLQEEEGEETGTEDRTGLIMSLPPVTHKTAGKGRFAHRYKYQHGKSKSLCTLETNLDEVGEEGSTGDNLKRIPSVHELRVTKSLQKLNVPDWFKQSSLSKSSSCLLKYGSNSTMNSLFMSPSLISSPCASTAPPAPNVVIRTRVVPATNPRTIRSPASILKNNGGGQTATAAAASTSAQAVKLPSERLREKEKNKSLMPIPIVPFSQIRAMFEKKGRKGTTKADPDDKVKDNKASSDLPSSTVKGETVNPTSTVPPSGVPHILIRGEEERERQAVEVRPAKRILFKEDRTLPASEEVHRSAFTSPTSSQPRVGARSERTVTNGVSGHLDSEVAARSVSPPRTESKEVSPSSEATSIDWLEDSHKDTTGSRGRPPAKPSHKDSMPIDSHKTGVAQHVDLHKTSPPQSPPKEKVKSPTRTLRGFFGLSKDKDKKSGSSGSGGSSLNSSFEGDGVYEREPRRLGVSEMSRRFEQSTPVSAFEQRGAGSADTSHESRQAMDTSHSSSEGNFRDPAGDSDRSDASANRGYSSSSHPASSSSFPASSGSSRPRHTAPTPSSNNNGGYEREPRVLKPSIQYPMDSGRGNDGAKYSRRLPGAGTVFGHGPVAENGDHDGTQGTLDTSTASSGGKDKKRVTETTV